MTNVTVTTVGLEELYAATRVLDDRVQGRLQAVAAATAFRVKARAQENLRSKTHGSGATAKAIGVVVDHPRKQYQVISQAPPDKPDVLPFWLEYGTRHMGARPYMRPAADAERESYAANMLAAAVDIMRGVLG